MVCSVLTKFDVNKNPKNPNMHKLKLTLLALALCGGLTTANATLTLVGSFDNPGNPADTLAFFQSQTGMTDAVACIDRLEFNDQSPGDVFTSGNFTFTFGTDATTGDQNVTVDFDLTGGDQVLCGFFVKGGDFGNLYTVAPDQGVSGSFVLNAPANASGGFANISHIDVFCCPGGTTVPDGGTTVMLLGSALTGLGLVRRYIKS